MSLVEKMIGKLSEQEAQDILDYIQSHEFSRSRLDAWMVSEAIKYHANKVDETPKERLSRLCEASNFLSEKFAQLPREIRKEIMARRKKG